MIRGQPDVRINARYETHSNHTSFLPASFFPFRSCLFLPSPRLRLRLESELESLLDWDELELLELELELFSLRLKHPIMSGRQMTTALP